MKAYRLPPVLVRSILVVSAALAVAFARVARSSAQTASVPRTLRAPPPGNAPQTVMTWPSEVCATAGGLRVEQACGCNDRLICTVVRIGASAIDLEVHTDPTAMRECTDCFPMTPATCPLPRLMPGR